MSKPAPSAPALGWVRLLVLCVCRAYRAVLVTLAAVAIAPTVLGNAPYVVRSGSMEPSIGVGDVVVARPLPADAEPRVGRVLVFANPARTDGELLVHRVVERLDDGTYTTAGDANPLPDSTPVARSAFEARAVLLAPYVGAPVVWWSDRDLVALALWLLVTIAAFVLAVDPRGGRRTSRSGPRGPGRRRACREPALARTTAAVQAGVVAMAVLCAGGTATAAFTATTANGSSSWVVGSWQQPYVAAVMADDPFLFYLLDEASGGWAADRSGNKRAGQLAGIAAYGLPGALPNNTGTAMDLGTSGRVVSDGVATAAPAHHTMELWFRTTTSTGGPLVGFENTRGSLSSVVDRQLAMLPGGRLTYGAWGAVSQKPITSLRSYNDGAWHHVAVVSTDKGALESTLLYVDGRLVAADTTTKTESYLGWWRFGAGTSMAAGSPQPARFAGVVDNLAVYTTALSAARVAAHYAAR